MRKDTVNLREQAEFCHEVFDGVFWVPTNALGRSKLSPGDINTLLKRSPAEKKAAIANLYEAIQLFRPAGSAG